MYQDRLIEIFLQLIKIEALSSYEKPVADHIKIFLESLGLNAITDNSSINTKSNTGNVICKIGSGGNILFSSHMDTARSTARVNPIFDNGTISSDGTTVLGVDNRAGISIILSLIEYITVNKIKTKDFTVAFTTCEETTIAGSKNLELENEINCAFVFDSYMRPGKFVTSSTGAISFEAVFKGKAAHSGIEPEKGINAILIGSEALLAIKQGRIDSKTTVNVGLAKGGNAVNVVPDSFFLKGEIRSTIKEDILDQLKIIENSFKRIAGKYKSSVNFNYVWDFEPFCISSDAEIFKNLKQAMENVGLNFQPEISMGGSDANSFNSRNISAINLGIGAQNPHSNSEFIFIEDLIKSFELALELVKIS